MRKAIVLVAAVVIVLSGIALVTARTNSAVQPVSASMSTFDLMSNAKDLPVAPHPDAF
jgi:hypothetical protein